MEDKTSSKSEFTFSKELNLQLEKSMYLINKITLVNNKKIDDFKNRSGSMNPDIEDLATIMSTQLYVLEEKYKVLYELTTDLYARLEHLQKD